MQKEEKNYAIQILKDEHNFNKANQILRGVKPPLAIWKVTERHIPSPVSFWSRANYFIGSQQGEQPDASNDITVIHDNTIPWDISLEKHHTEDKGLVNPDQLAI